jgi:hypothetical protein
MKVLLKAGADRNARDEVRTSFMSIRAVRKQTEDLYATTFIITPLNYLKLFIQSLLCPPLS